jgi:TolB-like protein/Tfp pilus assembly protein PilF
MRVDLERMSVPAYVVQPKRKPIRSSRWLWAAPCVVVVTAIVILLNVGGIRERLVGDSVPRIDSIAVLPLENLSGDPEQEYFSDGMTEELIAELAKIGALRVISRQSVMQFKGTDKPLPEIVKALNVDALIEGSVRRFGDRVRITTQLVQASPEQNLWAESYEREMQDILTLQSDVAQAIAREIRITVTPEEEARLSRARRVDPEVYEACLRAQFKLNYTRPEEAKKYIQEAIEKDPTYAPAYALLARYYAQLTYFAASAPKDVFPKAKAAATKALEFDETLAGARASLALVLYAYDWDWLGAERQFRRALELNPGLADAHRSYSMFLSAMGRHEEAIAEARRAQDLDPLEPFVNLGLGAAFRFASRYDEAIEQLQDAIEMYPTHGFTYTHLGWAYGRGGRYREALAAFQEANTLLGEGDLRNRAMFAHTCALSGRRDQAQKILDELQELEKRRYVPPMYIAMIYISLGKKEKAIQWLEKAYEVRDGDMFLLKFTPLEPLNDDLRGDPRFQDLLRRMNFPE